MVQVVTSWERLGSRLKFSVFSKLLLVWSGAVRVGSKMFIPIEGNDIETSEVTESSVVDNSSTLEYIYPRDTFE